MKRSGEQIDASQASQTRRSIKLASALTAVAALASGSANPDMHIQPLSYAHARQYAEEVVNTFDTCHIVSDPQVVKTYKGNQREPRSQINFDIQTTRNFPGEQTEKLLNKDHRVQWDSSIFGFAVAKDATGQPKLGRNIDNNGGGFFASRVLEPRSKVNLYPRADYKPGDQMAIFAQLTVNIAAYLNFETREPRTFEGYKLKYCGTLTHGGYGDPTAWHITPEGQSPVFPDIAKLKECQQVAVPQNPGQYDSICY